MDKSRPLVSIIAPCYNGEEYIKKFLDSVIYQTYSKIELIIINDGSTDKTKDILKSYENNFSKKGYIFEYFYQENQGIGAAINNALKLINGDYFTWIGTDDYLHPEYIEELVNFMETNREYAVVRNDGFIVDENDNSKILGKMADNNLDKYNEYLFENAILEKNFHFGYSMVRTTMFDEVNPKREIYPSREGQNWQILLPLFYYYKSAFYPRPLYYVVNNSESVSRSPRKSLEKSIKQQKEYELILINVIQKLNIEDKEYWLKIVEEKYMRRRLALGYQFNDFELVQKEYTLLKRRKKLTQTDRRFYYRSKYKLINKILKMMRRFVR